MTILHAAAPDITEFLDSGSRMTDKLRAAVKEKRDSGTAASSDDQVRIAFSPLFSSFEDVRQTAENLYGLLKN